MNADDEVAVQVRKIHAGANPDWRVTGYKFFPYAARQDKRWWVLRMNYDFPEHDLYTVFIDGIATFDVSGNRHSTVPLVASVGLLSPCAAAPDRPLMLVDEAETVVLPCTPFLVYGSEVGDPCDWCEHLADHDPFELRPGIRPPPR